MADAQKRFFFFKFSGNKIQQNDKYDIIPLTRPKVNSKGGVYMKFK